MKRPGKGPRGPRRPGKPWKPRPAGERPERPVMAPPPRPRTGEAEAEVTIEKLVAGGEGLARFEGMSLFVPRSAPGDRLRVRIVERRPDYGRAEIVAILAPGPGRRPDPVPELADWGGCDLQHIEDDLQPVLKGQAVRETLERMARIPLPASMPVIHGEAWGYRLRTQVHTQVEEGAVRVGYHARGSNRLIPVLRCPLLVPELEELLARLPGLLAGQLAAGEAPPRRIDLAAGDGGVVTASPLVPGLAHGEVTTAVLDLAYAYDARCFFQAHRGLLPRLVEVAVGPWTGGEAYDLYAGVGLFSLPLARRYDRVVAVEGDRVAARFARTNSRRNRLGRGQEIEGVAQAVESWIAALPAGAARAVVDPPRAGLAPVVRQALRARRPERLTYVSCHAATLARDLADLAAVYAVESVTLLDLFPQTGHMEAVVQMVLR
jgi:23S rRNA (uracil1939-C5)-methyltransferase